MEDRVARIISYVFHPLFVPLYSLALIFQLENLTVYLIPDKAKWLIMGMALTATIVLPFLLINLFIRKGLIKSLQMESREERIYPYLLMMLVYYVMYLLFSTIKLPVIAGGMFLGTSVVILAVVVINFWWKISIHAAAMGGMTGAFTAIAIRYELDIILLISVLIFCSGLVGFARLKLNAHKPTQVYAGFLVGMIGLMLVYFLL